MRWTAIVAEIEKPPIDPSAYLAELVNQAVKKIDVRATTEEQFYTALKEELMRDKAVKTVFIIRGLYAPSDDTAERLAYQIFKTKYPDSLPTIGCVVMPSFYQIIDPVKENRDASATKLLGAILLFDLVTIAARLLRS